VHKLPKGIPPNPLDKKAGVRGPVAKLVTRKSFSELLRRVMWWLNTNVSEDSAASIFRSEARGERKVDIYIYRHIMRGRNRDKVSLVRGVR
jgi:hypothetical protein